MIVLVTLLAMGTLALDVAPVWARASSGGSRGSRSSSAPAAPTSPGVPTSPGRSLTTPSPAPNQPVQRPSFMSRWGGVLGGLLLGGLLGSLLFGGFGGGIGLLDILVLGGLVLLVVAFLRRRGQTPEPAYAMAGGGGSPAPPVTMEMPRGTADLDRGLAHIRSMDPGFDPAALVDTARRAFVDVQAAMTARDLSRVRDRVTAEMLGLLQGQCDSLRAAGQINRIERIDVRRAELTEAWQEGGQDYATAFLSVSLLDYTVDGRGAVVEGSTSEPQDIEEYWTFTRPVGPSPWRLCAIQTS
jgi:predicted lipid-binding transport protein (Tim44 family)